MKARLFTLAALLLAGAATGTMAQDRQWGGGGPGGRYGGGRAPDAPQAQPAPAPQPAPSAARPDGGGRRGGDGGGRWNGGGGRGERQAQPAPAPQPPPSAPQAEGGRRGGGDGGARWNGGHGGRRDWQGQPPAPDARQGGPGGRFGGGERRDLNRNDGGRRDENRNDGVGRRDGNRNDGGGRNWNGDAGQRPDWNRNSGGDRRDWGGAERGRNVERWAPNRFPRSYRSEQRFRGQGWRAPRGYYARAWRFGEILPRGWYDPDYRLFDWWEYDLPEPPPGYDWVRVGDDALLIDDYTGRIVQVVRFVFW